MFLKYFGNFTGKPLCSSLFVIKCFPVNIAKFLKTTPGDCFWFSTSSVEVTGSNQRITALVDVIICLYDALVKLFDWNIIILYKYLFHNSVKDWYLFGKADHIWSLICSEHSMWPHQYNVNLSVL